MSIKSKVLAAAATLTLAGGLAVSVNGPAFAFIVAQETCVSSGAGSGTCMNDWNGTSGMVYGYHNNASNEVFSYETIGRCGGVALVTSTCPFTNHSMDNALLGAGIIQIEHISDSGSNLGCTADVDDDLIVTLGSCNSQATGSGGSFASVLVVARNGSLVDVGWTNDLGTWVQLNSNGGSAQMVYYGSSNPSIWNLGS
jgi:hypothetical protein